VAAQDDFARIRTEFIDPFQHDYEAIRPVVLHSETAAERSRQTGIDRTTIADKAKRFVTGGMLGLADGRTQPTVSEGSIYPDGIAAYILYLKQRYPPFTCVRSSGFYGVSSPTRPTTTPSNGF
jgi:hypothetical protein